MNERLFRKAKKVVDMFKEAGELVRTNPDNPKGKALRRAAIWLSGHLYGLIEEVEKIEASQSDAAALNFLNEYEAYREGDAVSFTPSPEVLEAFRKAVKG